MNTCFKNQSTNAKVVNEWLDFTNSESQNGW